MLENMFKAINITLDKIVIINLDYKKTMFNNEPLDFEIIVSRYIKILKPKFLVNMCSSKN